MNEHFRKTLVLVLLFIPACLVAGIYGFLHDQVSYTVSQEYFTHLKFDQFGISSAWRNRLGAGVVGILATWWMGLLGGAVLMPVGLVIPGWRNYLRIVAFSFPHVALTALATGVGALVFGLLFFDASNLPFMRIPRGVEDVVNFCVVGNMHNFSYIGGGLGILVGVGNIIMKNKKIRKESGLLEKSSGKNARPRVG